MLQQCSQDMPPMQPSTPLMPNTLCFLPSLNLRSALPTCLKHHPQPGLPSLHSCSPLKMRLQCRPPSLPSLLLMLLHPQLILSNTYNCYAPVAP
ncbi:hypothetical protein O181_026853 [Austropuccinia psidii MF-1]|uniref:Uncharacterized protein n=1 Tax=Austropuccinia psidii MF-1 TaxID=1389203 RepID=A0A9Q3CQM1_9BASI|nr:hypothetical protein [Austropuccinia psidii MF-1]